MPLPSDIQAFVDAHHPCPEGVERLTEHASMEAAWDASTHGSFLAYILKKLGVATDATRAVAAEHREALSAAFRAAVKTYPTGEARLQDLDAAYGAALAAFATDLKAAAPNPFTV
jgi:hypothetical protein